MDADGTVIPGKTALLITSSGSSDLKFLLGIVNSTLAFFYLKEKYIASSYNQGTTFTKEMLNTLPIPPVPPRESAELVSVVDRIISAKKRGAESDTVSLEIALDDLAYELYGLAKKDIATIESHVGNRTAASSVGQEEAAV